MRTPGLLLRKLLLSVSHFHFCEARPPCAMSADLQIHGWCHRFCTELFLLELCESRLGRPVQTSGTFICEGRGLCGPATQPAVEPVAQAGPRGVADRAPRRFCENSLNFVPLLNRYRTSRYPPGNRGCRMGMSGGILFIAFRGSGRSRAMQQSVELSTTKRVLTQQSSIFFFNFFTSLLVASSACLG